MGILDLVASNSASNDSGGLSGLFNSPLAMLFMPRAAARFQEAQKQNFLMQQIQRKQEFAYKFAQSIKDTDPLSAAAIIADPSNIDNVLTMYNANRQDEKKHKWEVEQHATDAKTKFDNDVKLKGILDAPTQQWQSIEKNLVSDAVAPKGNMANPNVEGPRPDGQLQQGQTSPDAELIRKTIAAQTGIPDLSLQEAIAIMTQPGALKEIRDNRQQRYNTDTTAATAAGNQSIDLLKLKDNQVDRSTKTSVVWENGKAYTKSWDDATGGFTKMVGEAPPNAALEALKGDHIIKVGPDGKNHIYNRDEAGNFTRDQGLAEEKQKILSQTTNADGSVTTTYAAPGASGKTTESEQKGKSLYEGSKDQYDIAMSKFDSLNEPRNKWGNQFGTVGRWWMSDDGQQAHDALQQVAQNYIYAMSGQQAPEQEVNRIMTLVFPNPADHEGAANNRKILLASMMRAIKSRLPDGYLSDYAKAPKWDGTKTVPMPTMDMPPPPPGIKEEFWKAHPEKWLDFEDVK